MYNERFHMYSYVSIDLNYSYKVFLLMQVLKCNVEFEDRRRIFDGHFTSVVEVCRNAIQP